jgi:hypothetical protein
MDKVRNALFVPHGAPTFALEPGAAGEAMSQVATDPTRVQRTLWPWAKHSKNSRIKVSW